ncbi:hypothetical protein C7S20_00155 [Christiangramia fulva]|uniref:Uncharacterized protein n=1 Tax=Christiangramia fulva TaxID=2126553 RepID=A0A2R3Z0M6_9FLAO|nr:hypothetical protein C7S20_00155 [Christiangramia fulva]
MWVKPRDPGEAIFSIASPRVFFHGFLAFSPKNSLKKASFSLLRFFWTSKRNEGSQTPVYFIKIKH